MTKRKVKVGMTNKIDKAREFARAAHDSIGQKRKYSGAPYWTHTQEVAEIVASLPDSTEDMICAAHLHDVLEDVSPLNPVFSIGQISIEFGYYVGEMVGALTDEYTKERYPSWNRNKRKIAEAERLCKCAPSVKTIKLADLLTNTRDIVVADPEFAVTYLREKEQMMPFLIGGDESLWNRVNNHLAEQQPTSPPDSQPD